MHRAFVHALQAVLVVRKVLLEVGPQTHLGHLLVGPWMAGRVWASEHISSFSEYMPMHGRKYLIARRGRIASVSLGISKLGARQRNGLLAMLNDVLRLPTVLVTRSFKIQEEPRCTIGFSLELAVASSVSS